jgi:DNA-binding NtrC family response regulator
MSYKFFFVDDDPQTKELYDIFLKRKLGGGFKFNFFVAGEGCLKYMRETCRPEDKILIFTDISMGNMNGLMLLDEVKSEFDHVEVVICSGYNSSEYKAKAEELGALAFFSKPINFPEVAKLIEARFAL